MLIPKTTKFVEENYNIEEEAATASLFTTGNGYIGVRGSFEEYGSLRIQGAYIRGVIDEVIDVVEPFADNEYMKKYYFDEESLKTFEYTESIINNVDFLLIRISINGETFYPWEGKIHSWERYIDMTTATLTRKVRWENSKGDITDFEFERFSSFDCDHVYCIKVKITPINHNGKISVMSGIDTRSKTTGQKAITPISYDAWENKTFAHSKIGRKYGFETGVTTVTNISGTNSVWSGKNEGGLLYSFAEFDSKESNEYVVEKAVYIVSSREEDVKKPTILEDSYDNYFKKHMWEYKKLYDMVNIEIEGDDMADSGIRFANYHTLISASRHDCIHSIAAKGLTGEMYKNFVWWDCEVYQLPFFIHTCPEAAKMALMYRYNILEQAKINSKEDGHKGAKYAFNSSVTGDEQVHAYIRHPFHQIHINADVAWGIINYVTVTGDIEFLKEYGFEILVELCKYWESRVELNDGRYEIKYVTGTDEHHPYVDNDAYTNYLVKFVLEKTSEYAKKLGYDYDFTEISEKLYQPITESGLIPQFDGYFDLSRTLEIAGGTSAKSRQMKASGLYHKSQVIKQPDVMLIYSYLNLKPEASNYALNWDYYEQMCESSSSLSYAPHAICAADNERMLSAYNYLMESTYMDVKDIHNCTWQGVHSGCLAGAWYSVFRGIAGIVCRDNHIEINPHLIPWWKNVKFNFMYNGSKISVSITPHAYSITADSDVNIVYRGKEISIVSGENMVLDV